MAREIPKEVIEQMPSLTEVAGIDVVYDLGCGDGTQCHHGR
jgi:hypothetical protein